MIKTKIVETTEKYDENGKLVEKITREETTEDDETRYPITTTTPWVTPCIHDTGRPIPNEPYCTTCTTTVTNSVENK